MLQAFSLLSAASAVLASVHVPLQRQSDVPDLAHQYAPQIQFHPDEQYFSSSIDAFLSRVHAQGPSHAPLPQPAPLTRHNLASSLPNFGSDAFQVDKNTDADPVTDRDGNLPEEFGWMRGERPEGGVGPPVYVLRAGRKGGEFDLYYWLFYPYNLGKVYPGLEDFGYTGDHLGDWERIRIRFSPDEKPQEVEYYAHSGGQGQGPLNWDDPLLTKIEGTHPLVYTANGSHGLWSFRGEHIYETVADKYPLSDLTADGGAVWSAWRSPLEVYDWSASASAGDYEGDGAWLGFGGKWGNQGQGECGKPEGVKDCPLTDGPSTPSWQVEKDI